MAAGNMADGIRHREDRETKGERHSNQTNTHSSKSGRKDSTAASSKDEPECSNEFRRTTLPDIDVLLSVFAV